VVVNDGFNTTESQVNVVVSQLPLVSLGTDVTVCPLDSIVLTANNPGMSYYWSNGSIEESITIGTTGIGFDLKTIWVEVENEDGCVGTDTIRVVFDFAQCFGVDENDNEDRFYVYPNPTSGKTQFEWEGIFGDVELKISDLQGNVIHSQVIQTPPSGEYKGSFNLNGNPGGIYLLRLIGEEKVLIRKILLQ
jgi:hypothetical protein